MMLQGSSSFLKRKLFAVLSTFAACYFPICLNAARYALYKSGSNKQGCSEPSPQNLMTNLG